MEFVVQAVDRGVRSSGQGAVTLHLHLMEDVGASDTVVMKQYAHALLTEDGGNGANTERVVNIVAQERRLGQGSVTILRNLMEGGAASGRIAMKQHATGIAVQEIVSVNSDHIFKYKSAAQPAINVVRVKVTATKILNVLEILYVDGIIVMTRNSRIMTKRIVVEKAKVFGRKGM